MARARLKLHITKSQLETDFGFYCKELELAGMIEKYNPNPMTRVISEPVYYKSIARTKKEKTKTLLNRHEYTPDVVIKWKKEARNIFWRRWEDEKYPDVPFLANYNKEKDFYYTIVEVKPGFDMENMTRLFSINQKWIMASMGLYVQKVVMCNDERSIFAKTFTPIKWMTTPIQGKPRTIKFEVRGIGQYIAKRKELLNL